MIASPLAGLHEGTEASAAELEARYLLPVYKHLALEPVRGEGVWLETADGRRVLDLYGGHAVALLGYGHPRLAGGARAPGRGAPLPVERRAEPRARPGRRGARRLRARGTRAGLLRQQRRRGERERAAPRLSQDRAPQGGGDRGRLPRPHRGGGGGLLGLGALVRLSSASRSTSSSCRAATSDGSPQAVDDDTAALILEPVQGLAGAYRARSRVPDRSPRGRPSRGRRPADLRRGPVRSRQERRAVRRRGCTA